RRRADPVLAAHLGGRKPGLLLAQHRNDLLFREPRSLHRPVLPSGRTLASSGGNNGGHSTRRKPRFDRAGSDFAHTELCSRRRSRLVSGSEGDRLENVLGEMAHYGNHDPIASEVIGFIVLLRKTIGLRKPHQARSLPP